MRCLSPFRIAVLAVFGVFGVIGPGLAQPSFPTPKTYPPDAATLKQILAKTAELKKTLATLPKDTPDSETIWADVAIYHKAAEWIVRHGEWFQKDSAQQTLRILDAGQERARAAAQGKSPWRDARGKPVALGYISHIDQSVQPYRVTIPEGYGKPGATWRVDFVLHGRDGTLTEVKFLNAAVVAKPGASNKFIVVEPYGRGNNAYRWAGETDVFEASVAFRRAYEGPHLDLLGHGRRVIRGFSMGGAGTWHIGLHHPFTFSVMGPGAGFTTTRGYIKNLPAKLPEYQEKCLRIYDAVDYAENAFNIPVVAYSGEKDAQKAAADNIENALKGFKEPLRFTHLVAPGLAHQMPPEWQAKAEAEYARFATGPAAAETPEHVRFVTYTVRYSTFGHGVIRELDQHYSQAIVDSHQSAERFTITTRNIAAMTLFVYHPLPSVTIDGQVIKFDGPPNLTEVRKRNGKWQLVPRGGSLKSTRKRDGLTSIQGPIDDAFMDWFKVLRPTRAGWHPKTTSAIQATQNRFASEWDKWLRGDLPFQPVDLKSYRTSEAANLILFGDPQSNPAIADILPKLPITWTQDKLVVNGVEYDAKTHVPVLIYPNPNNSSFYVVLNSGHTFHDADFRGTNALLYPRLGDWAVLKPTPTEKDPAAAEVVAAGLFDENWQFPKKSK